MVLQIINDKEFDAMSKAAGDIPIVIDFYATWCKPCTAMAPIFAKLASVVGEKKAIFVKVNVEECEKTAEMFEVRAMPTFCLVKNGKVVKRVVGANPKKLIELAEGL